jgi:PPM family protein phosphatase
MVAYHGHTDVGRRRSLNEDTIHAQDRLFVVCDGMGGHKAGEVASKLAVEAIAGFIRRSEEDPEMTWPYGFNTQISYDENRLNTAIRLANRVVFRNAASSDEYTGMGTTVVAAMVSPRQAEVTYAHVGDSRIYLIRGGLMRQLTRDDTWANVAAGADLDATSPMRNVLTKALGAREEVDFDVGRLALETGDVILLCSDGLTNMLSDAQILEIVVARCPDLEAVCRALVTAANEQGGRDNISVVVVSSTS